jgi:ribosomal protein S15P/S13E
MARIMMSLRILKMMMIIVDRSKNISERGLNIVTSNMRRVMEFMKKEKSIQQRKLL